MPEPASDPIDGFEPIAIVYSIPEAMVLLATLRAYGIFALPRNHGHISVAPSLMLALGGVWITVAPDQVEDAVALMEEVDQGWQCPPPLISDAPWLSGLYSIGITFMGAPPMPRAPGIYRWRSARDASGNRL
jgi:hypothetical protein